MREDNVILKGAESSGIHDGKIAAVTMVRDDSFFLQKWVEYYGRELGKENLYIFFDGLDQEVPEFCNGIQCRVVGKIGNDVKSSDKGRIRFVSGEARKLFKAGYEKVIGGDADEYLVVDPSLGKNLKQYLSEKDIGWTLSGLGLDFGQKIPGEESLSLDRPFLEQRKYAQIGTRYTKASVLGRPGEWGSGFHRMKHHDFTIGKGLYLMHFGYSDLSMIERRMANTDRLNQGWEKHMKKRSRTIRYVNSLVSHNFDKTVKIARKIETICRPPYAWNKPALMGWKTIVEIPERFRDCL